MTSLSRKRALQDLTLPCRRINSRDLPFPSLFQLATNTCISHLHIFASFQGLPFHPFGKALYTEFTHRSNQWRITTEQRQVGILLFAEAYGCDQTDHDDDKSQGDVLGSEYSALRCRLVQDIPYLSIFADCLVYLDLSGGGTHFEGNTLDGDHVGFTDKDMAGLSSLSQLRILNLAQLRIGDVGLSHLVRSVTFGSSGPAGLEYLDLSGTDVTDAGLSKMFIRNERLPLQSNTRKDRLVFKRLLGIDLSLSKVHDEVAEALFFGSSAGRGGWNRSEYPTTLFPTLSTKAALKNGTHDESGRGGRPCYQEPGSGSNPMQKYVDRLDRSYKLKFAQRPDLSVTGRDGLGLAECLALEKLGQIYLHPVSEETSSSSSSHWNQYGDEGHRHTPDMAADRIRARGQRTRRRRYTEEFEEALRAAIAIKHKPHGKNLEHMFNLTMYQRVLDSVRETAAVAARPKLKTPVFGKRQLTFVRSRADLSESLLRDMGIEEPGLQESVQKEQQGAIAVKRGTSGVTIAKIRDRYQRPTPPSIRISDAELVPSYNIKQKPPQLCSEAWSSSLSAPHTKRVKLASPNFVKQDPSTSIPPHDHHLPGRRRGMGGSYSYPPVHQPFLKPAEEQTSSSIFITPTPVKDEHKPHPGPTMGLKQAPFSTGPKLVKSSAAMMEGWVRQVGPLAGTPPSTASCKAQGPLLKGSKKIGASNPSSSIVREFSFSNGDKNIVNLARWVRVGHAGPGTNDQDGAKRKVIRFDPKSKRFADDGDRDQVQQEPDDP
ncbi:hypothetical protein EDD11_010188 [Mortierella claussenii]|nr:hypothetical protein EDD11_010188 [Mortierella claussenii]